MGTRKKYGRKSITNKNMISYMTKFLFIVTIVLSAAIFFSCSKENNVNKTVNTDTNKTVEPKIVKRDTVIEKVKDYSDINIFWKDFKDAMIKKDKKSISEMTHFPFMLQSQFVYKDEFLQDFNKSMKNVIANIIKSKLPKRSQMMIGGGLDTKGNAVDVEWKEGSLLETQSEYIYLYFGKSSGIYKFIGLLYGE